MGEARSRGFQLAQSNPNSGAAGAIQRDGQVRRRLAGSDRIHDAAFDRKTSGKSKTLDHPLKQIMTCGVERFGAASVAHRMAGVEMPQGDSRLGDRLGGGMGPAAFQEFRQNMRVRPVRAFARRRWNRLIHLNAADPADEDPMRVCFKQQAHRGIRRIKTERPQWLRSRATVF